MKKKTKKPKAGKYILFGLIAVALYVALYLCGVNLIEYYPAFIGGLAIKLITYLGKKWFGWNLGFLQSDEANEEAGKAIISTQKKYGKKLAGKIRGKVAAIKYHKKTGAGYLKSRLAVKLAYGVTKKENSELWE